WQCGHLLRLATVGHGRISTLHLEPDLRYLAAWIISDYYHRSYFGNTYDNRQLSDHSASRRLGKHSRNGDRDLHHHHQPDTAAPGHNKFVAGRYAGRTGPACTNSSKAT